MTTTTTSVRSAVKTYLVDQLESRLDPVPVAYGWPGRNLERDHVWIDRVTGNVEFPLAMAGRKSRNDDFTVRVVFQASAPGDSILEADARAEEFYGHLEDLIAGDVSLGTMDGVVHAVLGAVEGPSGELTDEGAVSFVIADVAVKARLL